MKIKKTIIGMVMAAISVTTVLAANPPALLQAYPVEPLNTAEQDAIMYMLEEEKVARDAYLALGAMWDTPIFTTIAKAEQVHMDRVAELVERYALPVPATIETPGVFENEDLQGLYDMLVEQGSESYDTALQVGVTIEETDIADLRESLVEVDNADIRAVFERLLAGSENHLAAFSRQLDSGSSGTGRGARVNGRVGGRGATVGGPRNRW